MNVFTGPSWSDMIVDLGSQVFIPVVSPHYRAPFSFARSSLSSFTAQRNQQPNNRPRMIHENAYSDEPSTGTDRLLVGSSSRDEYSRSDQRAGTQSLDHDSERNEWR